MHKNPSLPLPQIIKPKPTQKIEQPWENKDKFISDAREFLKILLLARSPTVQDWPEELFNKSIYWAQYFESVLDAMPEENDSHLDPLLAGVINAIRSEFPELRLRTVNCALLASARHAFLRTLLENPFLSPSGLRFVVNGYLEIPVEDGSTTQKNEKQKQFLRKDFMRRAQLQSFVNSLRLLQAKALDHLAPTMSENATIRVEILIGVPRVDGDQPFGDILLDKSYPFSLAAVKRKAYAKLVRAELDRLSADPEQLTLFQNKILSLLRPRKGATAADIERSIVPLREQLWWILLVSPSSSLAQTKKNSATTTAASSSPSPSFLSNAFLCEWILSKCDSDSELFLFDGVSPWLLAEVSYRHRPVCETYFAHLLLRSQKLTLPTLGNPTLLDEKKKADKAALELSWAHLINKDAELADFCVQILSHASSYLRIHSASSSTPMEGTEDLMHL